MGYSEHLGSIGSLRRAYPKDFLGGLTVLFEEAARAEKLLANLDREKADRTRDTETRLSNATKEYDKAKQRLDAITPELERKRRESNDEVAKLQTRLSEQEHAAESRAASARKEMGAQREHLQAVIDAKKEELAEVSAKLLKVKEQHSAFLSHVGAVAR